MIPVTRAALRSPLWGPLLDILEGPFMTTQELAARWRYTDDHLSNLRRAGKGPPFTKLEGGAVRYRVSDVVAFELDGMGGPPSLDAVALALASCPALTEDARRAAIDHVRAALGRPSAGKG